MSGFYFNTISEELKVVISSICTDPFFNHYRLFGGTGLSLQIGHRISIDADFITQEEINNEALVGYLLANYPNVKDIRSNNLGVFLKIGTIKVDFLSWKKSFIRNEVICQNIRVMHIEEIIAHKIFAIQNRGEKKDYIDIASLLRTYSLPQMIEFYAEKYNNSSALFLSKYLVSFSDIENQPMPNMLLDLDWEKAKSLLSSAVNELLSK